MRARGVPGRPRPGLRCAALLLAAVLAVGAALALRWLREDRGRMAPVVSWQDGAVYGPWRSVFHGYGSNTGAADALTLTPRAAGRPGATHAALVVSTARYQRLDYRAGMRTVRQLRTTAPNPWEVAWLVWAYTDPEHFYYLALKPNGWELGKRDPEYRGGQRFLATGAPRFPIGTWSTVRVRQRGARLAVAVDDRPLVDFTDRERPYPAGSVGAYTEDARAEFRNITIEGTRKGPGFPAPLDGSPPAP
ncbi:calcium-binding protein [Streptomyces albus subsp. albus]|nr:calcium-binding protein [Streptomyces albus subsp. albus]